MGATPHKGFTNERLTFALRLAEKSATADESCRNIDVSEPICFR